MLTCFRGWRRKAGCATLVMALMVLCAWARSRLCTDDFVLAFSKKTAVIATIKCRCIQLSWKWQDEPGYLHKNDGGMQFFEVMFDDTKTFDRRTAPFVNPDDDPFKDLQWSWRLGSAGFGGLVLGPIGSRDLIIPYWPLILILTLTSGWLLLGKSRKVSSAIMDHRNE